MIIKMKKRKNVSKHDLRRELESSKRMLIFTMQKLQTIETVFSDYIDFQGSEDSFSKFLEEKYKQLEQEETEPV